MKTGTWFDSKEYDQGNPVRNIAYNSQLHKTTLLNINAKADLEIFKGFVAGISLLNSVKWMTTVNIIITNRSREKRSGVCKKRKLDKGQKSAGIYTEIHQGIK